MKIKSNKHSASAGHASSKSADNKNLDYIFVKPASSNASMKEGWISDFLNKQGIFQINLSVAMEECHPF